MIAPFRSVGAPKGWMSTPFRGVGAPKGWMTTPSRGAGAPEGWMTHALPRRGRARGLEEDDRASACVRPTPDAHCATLPMSVIRQLIRHPLTDMGLAKFLEDNKKASAAAK